MSFFRTNQNSNYKQDNSKKIQTNLRAKTFLLNSSFIGTIKSKLSEKRVSPFPSFFCKGSMAVEAALAVPFFLFFFMNILFSFEILRLQSNLIAALHQTGNEMAFNACQNTNINGTLSSFLSQGYAKGKIIERAGGEYLDNSCLSGGSKGLNFTKSAVMRRQDMIELVVSYRVHPFIRVVGFPDFHMENRYYGRAWTGYDVEKRNAGGEKEDSLVFITATGTVYHWERDCTYLNPSVQVVSAAMLSECRNGNGGKYYPCEKCGVDRIKAVLFVTSEGDRYHSRLDCPSLKRTVYTVHLSEVNGKSECSKCRSPE